MAIEFMASIHETVAKTFKRGIRRFGVQLLIALSVSPISYADNATGIRVRSFTVLPSLELAGEYIDNIYRQETNEEGDFLARLLPKVSVESKWSRHALGFTASSDMAFYGDHPREDYQNFNADLHGRIDVHRDSYATLQGGLSRGIQQRGSPDDRFGNEPTVSYDYFGAFDYFRRFNRLSANIGHRIDYYTFNDVSGADSATASSLNIDPQTSAQEEAFFLHNSDRNFVGNATHLRLGYLLKTGYEAFIRGTYTSRVYDQETDDFGYQRSSNGYGVDAGVGFDLTALLKGDVFVGYQSQSYDDTRLSSTDGIGGGIDLIWTPTRLTTVKASFVSAVNETSLSGVSGYYSRMFILSAEHELRRNIILSAKAGYGNNDYNGVQLDINGNPTAGDTQRNENVYLAGAGVKYLMHRNFYARAYYDFFKRDVNIEGNNYDWNRFGIAIGASY